MAAALSLYSRPKSLRPCLDAFNDFIEGRIDRAELDRRTRELEDRQLNLPMREVENDLFVSRQRA